MKKIGRAFGGEDVNSNAAEREMCNSVVVPAKEYLSEACRKA